MTRHSLRYETSLIERFPSPAYGGVAHLINDIAGVLVPSLPELSSCSSGRLLVEKSLELGSSTHPLMFIDGDSAL